MKKIVLVFLIVCSAISQTTSAGNKWLLEKLGKSDFAISRSYLDSFDQLSARERVLLYYLFRAAVAGRDIFYDQRHRDALAIRRLIESLITQPKEIPSDLQKKLLTYAKYLWINSSQYHIRTGLKFSPPFSLEELKLVIPQKDLSDLRASIFEEKTEPVLTNLTPKPGEGDIIQTSANNIYDRGLKLSDIDHLSASWRTKLNVRFAKSNPGIQPQIYKIGGVYGKELSNVVYFLKKALPLTDGLQKSSIENLIRYYETGDEELFRKASIDWLQALPTVDTANGFIESYMDPRQVVGSWEGVAYYTAKDPILQGFSSNVQYFEDHMPWAEIYKKKNISSKPVATLINVAVAVGEGGPVTWSGINLPNYQDIRAKYGSKNVVLSNMIEARSQVTQDITIKEFYFPEYQNLMKKYYRLARFMHLYMHEVIGHGSGAVDSKLKVDPKNIIGKNYGAWEEARATLVAWHHIFDPKLVELGAFKKEEQEDVAKAFCLMELQNQLVNLRNAKNEDVLREAHDRANQLIFEYLRQNTKGFEVIQNSGKYYVKILAPKELHRGASELLKIVHEAKATGNKVKVDSLMEQYGNRFNKDWRDNIVQRAEVVGLPELVAMVFPKLIPVLKDGEVMDVKLDNSESFADQQLRFSRISETQKIDKDYY